MVLPAAYVLFTFLKNLYFCISIFVKSAYQSTLVGVSIVRRVPQFEKTYSRQIATSVMT